MTRKEVENGAVEEKELGFRVLEDLTVETK